MLSLTIKNYKGVEVNHIQRSLSADESELQLKERIIRKIVESNDIDTPQEMIEEEVELMTFEMNHQLKYQNLAAGGYTDITQFDLAARMEQIRTDATNLVKTRLVIHGIIDAEALAVTKEELENEAKAIADRQKMPIEMVMDFFGSDLEPLKDDLLVRKAIDLIYANAVIK